MKLFLILIFLNYIKNDDLKRSWCWTAPMVNDRDYKYDPSKGGLNWGFCKNSPTETTEYKITVFTSSHSNSETRYIIIKTAPKFLYKCSAKRVKKQNQ
jgi:hypothetical protein